MSIIVEQEPIFLDQYWTGLGGPCLDKEGAPLDDGPDFGDDMDAALAWLRGLDDEHDGLDEHGRGGFGGPGLGDRDEVASLDGFGERLEMTLFAALLQIPSLLAYACSEHLDLTGFTVRGLAELAGLAAWFFKTYRQAPPDWALLAESERLFAWDRRHWPYYAGRVRHAYDYVCADAYPLRWLKRKLRELSLRSKVRAGAATL